MLAVAQSNNQRFNAVMRADPTRTLTIRRAFVANVKRRFNVLKRIIRRAIVEKDVLALKEPVTTLELAVDIPIAEKAFDFPRAADKIDGFMKWLNDMEDQGILEVIKRPGAPLAPGEPWTNIYIQSAYQKGIARAQAELKKAGIEIAPAAEIAGIESFQAAFLVPFHVDRVGLLYTRAFNELHGIDDAMDQAISRVLAQGIAEGRNPRQIAKILVEQVDKIGITRATMMARTEVVRAHHMATIGEYRQAGIEGVTVQVEWSTAGYNVCPKCEELQGRIFSIDEVEGMIPRHPNCR